MLLSAASELSVVSVNLMKSGRDLSGYVQDAQRAVRDRVTLPSGYRLIWTSQYEHLARAEERLKLVVPVTSGIILLPLYLNFGSLAKSLIVLLSVPFAAIGAIWYLDYLCYNMSVAVWVGIIALAGVAAEIAWSCLSISTRPMSGVCEKVAWRRRMIYEKPLWKERSSACVRR